MGIGSTCVAVRKVPYGLVLPGRTTWTFAPRKAIWLPVGSRMIAQTVYGR